MNEIEKLKATIELQRKEIERKKSAVSEYFKQWEQDQETKSNLRKEIEGLVEGLKEAMRHIPRDFHSVHTDIEELIHKHTKSEDNGK